MGRNHPLNPGGWEQLGLIISETIHFSKKVLRTKVIGLKVLHLMVTLKLTLKLIFKVS